MKMTFENKFGTVDMFGEGNEGLCVCDVEGTELQGRERSLIKFCTKDGYEESSAAFGQRVITVSGDIRAENEEKIANAMRVFSSPGVLTIACGKTKRQITVNDTVFKTTRKNGMYKGFCAQMTCDMPHFTDCTDIFKGVYSRVNLITNETVLPAMFTKRSAGGNVENSGDVKAEPLIRIECLADAPEDGSITIANKTTGKKIILNHPMVKGEIVTVDIPERTITSSVSGDIFPSLDPDSYLYDIYLECGQNYIDVTAAEGDRNCEIYVIYRNLYTGMVI